MTDFRFEMARNVEECDRALIHIDNRWNDNIVKKTLNTRAHKFQANIFPKKSNPKDLTVDVYGKSSGKGEYFIKMSLKIIAKSNKQLALSEADIKIDAAYHWKKFASFEILEDLNQKHSYMFDGNKVLTLLFIVGVVDLYTLMEDECTELSGANKLLSDMEILMNNQDMCDVILCAEGREFPVNKCVICARSTVFAAMFETDMLEKKTNKVLIGDMSALALKELIYFVYTGKIRTFATDVLFEMYGAAEQYFLSDLKREAGRLLAMNLDNVIVCNVAETAYLHRDLHLLKKAVRYIYQNKESMSRSPSWTIFQPHWLTYSDAIRRSSFGHN